MQLGIRQARYFGHTKAKFQFHLAATVANLTLLADKIGLSGDPGPTFPVSTRVADAVVNYGANLRSNLRWVMVSLQWCGRPWHPHQEGLRSDFLGCSWISAGVWLRIITRSGRLTRSVLNSGPPPPTDN